MKMNRNLRTRRVKVVCPIRFLVGVLGMVLLAGCVQTIPYRANLRLTIPAEERRTEELTIRMSEELRSLVIKVKPIDIPGTIAYKFLIGKSLEANLTNTLSDLFDTVHVSTLPLSELGAQASVLEVELVNYDLHIAPSVFGTHSAKLDIRYSVYGAGRHQLFTLETNSEGTSAESKSLEWGRVYIPEYGFISTSPYRYRNTIGQAYDEALAKSIDKLVSKMIEVLPR